MELSEVDDGKLLREFTRTSYGRHVHAVVQRVARIGEEEGGVGEEVAMEGGGGNDGGVGEEGRRRGCFPPIPRQ